MPKAEKDRLHRAIAGALESVPREIIERQLARFDKANPSEAEGVRAALKL
jgi:catalase